ncbi:DUF2252 domain-containing protein [Rhodococcus triatomae]|uniref:Uncharacterized conserved protein, DUF2252 family n=1 Tax=Rhodococcus triatomae TaxID=300028 RepID=A0A1G8PS62_9NOCA|nr:DUF2252 domain-containing protein [Rhodococcus triatomae]QNG20179.1 DUF2252 domain-containing protein [Rhodococcus triatomae]QNG23905.1 DUF2252 domain-containing protein [Rhodococcus triatomae]SDI95178.1 Uncharacterized conserved protein, DUF2252 family [Rhodococcus triatomae]
MTENAGKNLRKTLPRRELATLRLPDRDPLAILEDQHRTRLADLIGVRVGRMLDSPFAYYRGTAAVMAADLAVEPVSGPRVVSCGDAHISNFGFFASPERTLLFDLNDFDEAGVASWEWDVKRLAASVYIGGRDLGLSEDECRAATVTAVQSYVTTLVELVQLSPFERYFVRVSSDDLEAALTGASRRITRKVTTKARTRTSEQVLAKITTRGDDGQLRIVDQAPVTRHVEHASAAEIEALYAQYRGTLREDSAFLLSQYRPTDVVLRVVGVGSVGTRCYVLALEGPDGDAVFLQAKEAQPSVLTTYGGMPATIPGSTDASDFAEGRRVVAGQRILQAQSDPFLGHIVGFAGDRGRDVRVDYYWRQFRDMKGSVELSRLPSAQFVEYGQVCGKLLARAHSQSPAAPTVAGYAGSGDRVPLALADWSAAYADVVEADFAALERAAEAGRLPVERGV